MRRLPLPAIPGLGGFLLLCGCKAEEKKVEAPPDPCHR